MIHVEIETLYGPPGGQSLGLGHTQVVALGHAGMAYRRSPSPTAYAAVHHLTLGRGELLGVSDLVETGDRVGHHRSHRQRPGPGPAADLVDAYHHLGSGRPQLPLDLQTGGLALEGRAQRRCRRGHRTLVTTTRPPGYRRPVIGGRGLGSSTGRTWAP